MSGLHSQRTCCGLPGSLLSYQHDRDTFSKVPRVSSGSASYYKGQSRKAQHRHRERSLSRTEETRAQVQASVLDIRGNVSPGPLLLPCTALSAKSREHQSPRRFLYLSAILKALKQKLQVINPSKWLLCIIFFFPIRELL